MTERSEQEADERRLVLITTFVVPEIMEDGFLTWWRMVKPYMSMQPGFISARLHKSLDQREQYRFVNISEWSGDAASRDALSKFWSSTTQPPIPGFEWRPVLYEAIESA